MTMSPRSSLTLRPGGAAAMVSHLLVLWPPLLFPLQTPRGLYKVVFSEEIRP